MRGRNPCVAFFVLWWLRLRTQPPELGAIVMPSDLTERLEEAIAEPVSASQDGRSATDRSIDDIIKADKHLASKEAAANGIGGLFRQILKPPSALG